MDEVNANLVECDLSEGVKYLRRLRFAEYFLIFFGIYLAGGLLVAIVNPPSLIFLIVICPVFAAAIVAYLSCGNLKPNLWRLYPFILPVAALAALFIGLLEAFGCTLVLMTFGFWVGLKSSKRFPLASPLR